MTITLTPQLEELVREKVLRGEYDSADALIGAAVRRLIEEEDRDLPSPAEIAAIEVGLAELERGEYVEFDADDLTGIARDVHARGLRRLLAERAGDDKLR